MTRVTEVAQDALNLSPLQNDQFCQMETAGFRLSQLRSRREYEKYSKRFDAFLRFGNKTLECAVDQVAFILLPDAYGAEFCPKESVPIDDHLSIKSLICAMSLPIVCHASRSLIKWFVFLIISPDGRFFSLFLNEIPKFLHAFLYLRAAAEKRRPAIAWVCGRDVASLRSIAESFRAATGDCP